jgi:hypothetical protein
VAVTWRDQPLVVAIAAHGLDGAAASWPTSPLGREAWDRLVGVVARQRLQGLLAFAVADGALPVTDPQRAEVAARHRDAMTDVLHLEARLLDVAEALDGAGLDWRAVKGSATAHLDYADPSQRVFGDVDVLVPAAHLRDAVDALAGIGARRTRPPLGHGFEQRFAKSVELVDGDGCQIDLHRTLALEPFGLRITEDDLFGAPVRFEAGGRKLPALPVETRFLLACYHASLGNYPVRLVPLRDVAQIASCPTLDVDRVVTLARRWWARAVAADAVRTAWALFGLPADAPVARWAGGYAPTRRESAALSAFQRPDRRQAHRTAATLATLPGLRARAAYLRAVLRPDRAYLASRGLGAGQWLRRSRALVGRGWSR